MSPRERQALALLVVLSTAALIAGWWTFWFLCDDAYIAFRYAHNLVHGRGLTWNPAPFAPVEGYSSFAWVVLLAGIWAVTGLEPPETANVVLLLASAGTLALAGWMGWRAARVPGAAFVLGCCLTNRTFFAWTSSGLEQGLFTLVLLAWVAVGTSGLRTSRSTTAWVALAAVLELVRPDGLLFLGITVPTVAWLRPRDLRVALWPLLVPLAHEAFRLWLYGEWLPNPYYAKHVAPWPASGLRYAAWFALEYGYVLLPALLLAAVWRPPPRPDLGTVAVLLGILGHWATYSLRIGGDHFEFRVYHHLVPLVAVGSLHLASRLPVGLAAGLLLVPWLAGLPIPWVHWAHTHELTERYTGGMPAHRVAPHFPPALRAWPQAWDDLQAWLVPRWVGLRHQTHVIYGAHVQPAQWPDRDEALGAEGDRLVLAINGVGYPGWVLPNVAILDGMGLNDRVIARAPVTLRDPDARRMAHDRDAPEGYLACFRPNVFRGRHRVRVKPRAEPLTDDEIRACEARFAPE